jgi:RNA polymerase sigma-70 factor (ECF subfamily)
MSDFTDVALAAEGDHQAFERLYRRYVIRIYSLCKRLSGSRTHGEELTREVFLRAWQKLPESRGESAYGAWLHRPGRRQIGRCQNRAGRLAHRNVER